MHPISQIDGRHLTSEGKQYLYCAGTSYLGISYDGDFSELLAEGISRFGSNYGGSRNANFQFPDLEALESRLAGWIGAEALITVSSGTFSGLLIREILDEYPLILFGPNPHPALQIYEGKQIPGGKKDWWNSLNNYLNSIPSQKVTLILNTVDPIQLDKLDLLKLALLTTRHEYLLILDDSHGLGVIGEEGKGVYPEIPSDWKEKTIVLGSLGKAMGLPGGFMAGSKKAIEQIRTSTLFSGASPVSPAYCYAYNQYFEKIPSRIRQLKVNIQKGHELFKDSHGWKTHQELPIITTTQSGMYEDGLKAGIMMSHFAYPDVHGEKITRLILNALHWEEDFDLLRVWLTAQN